VDRNFAEVAGDLAFGPVQALAAARFYSAVTNRQVNALHPAPNAVR
jgi:hypothetical protein